MKKNIDFISYPFLGEKKKLVDHEILTDELSSQLGYILSLETPLYDETFWVMDKVLHLNGSIRGKNAISEADIDYALQMYRELKERNKERLNGFVYPIGHPVACQYQLARCQAKKVVRNMHIIRQSGTEVDERLVDFANLLANLLFTFSLEVNRVNDVEEIPFISKSY
ncbi:MAG: hypothetical protein ACI35O_01990 [Bacillaceae bacterium]